MVQDPYPTFNGIAMDSERGEIIMADDNRSSLLAYDVEFEPSDRSTEARRAISGPKTHLGYTCTLAISPEHNEVYTVDNDWKDNMTVYPLDAKGETAPIRELNVDHGAWGIFLDRKNDEMFVTTEHVNKISVYRRTANGDDDALRYIQGAKTGLADPHGIYVDSESNEIFVTNHGHWRETKPGEGGTLFWGKRAMVRGTRAGGTPLAPSTGKFLPASITVYSRTASGDVAPLRTIQGPNTKLNWPLGIYLDPVNGQLVVANSGDNSILFFDKNANGDVAPARLIKGLATAIDGPSGVLADAKRNELWVTSWNTHIATVYPLNAQGNVVPTRVIRSAPQGTPATAGLGNPGAVAYDPKRKEILVPN
jgi:DNA-binding beta-propeller fold protein YncE